MIESETREGRKMGAWTEDERIRVEQLTRVGYKPAEIGRIIDRPRQQVCSVVFQLRRKGILQRIDLAESASPAGDIWPEGTAFHDVNPDTLARESCGGYGQLSRPLGYTAGGVARYG